MMNAETARIVTNEFKNRQLDRELKAILSAIEQAANNGFYILIYNYLSLPTCKTLENLGYVIADGAVKW